MIINLVNGNFIVKVSPQVISWCINADHSSTQWTFLELQLNIFCPFVSLGPEEGALSPSSSSHTEEQHVDTVTMTTASLNLQRGGAEGERKRRRREGETKQRTGAGGRGGPPDLDLDLVEEEAHEEEKQREEEGRRRQHKEERRRREEEEEEERKRRSQTVRQKMKDDQRDQGRMGRSFHRNVVQSWDTRPALHGVEESGEERRRSERKSRRRTRQEQKEDNTSTLHTKHSGSSAEAQKAAFSFLMPIDDTNGEHQRQSDSESAVSFSEVSLSAASITTSGWREDSDWAQPSWRQRDTPGPWLKPSPQRLTQVLTVSQPSRRGRQDGLSL